MQKKATKIVLSRETLRQLDRVQLSGLAGGLAVSVAQTIVSEGDSNDRRCEPSIVSCHIGCA